MTPEEKAKELFKNMYSIIFDIDNGVNVMQDEKRYNAAKQCAIRAVDEILEELQKLWSKYSYYCLAFELNYYEQVKTELLIM